MTFLPLLLSLVSPADAAKAPQIADAAIVPGCPANEDGSMSHCQERRVAWAHRLWSRGEVQYVITSGAAVHNHYVEADVMADALVALGVPAELVLRERDALHTDQNAAWSAGLAAASGFDSVVVASDYGQAQQVCTLVREWSDLTCRAAPIDYRTIGDSFLRGFEVPEFLSRPVSGWIPLREREESIAAMTGTAPRKGSMSIYLKDAVSGVRASAPALPPEPLRTASR